MRRPCGFASWVPRPAAACRSGTVAVPTARPPAGKQRGPGIAGCILTDAELDHTAGLLLLREGGPFGITCTPLVRRWLNRYLPVEPILACFAKPSWTELKELNVGVPLDLVL